CWRSRRIHSATYTALSCGAAVPPRAMPAAPVARRLWAHRRRLGIAPAPRPAGPWLPPHARKFASWHSPSPPRCRLHYVRFWCSLPGSSCWQRLDSFFWLMQAAGTNCFVQRVRQHLHPFGYLRHTLAFIQKCLGFLFHFVFQHRGRPPLRRGEKLFPAALTESFHIPLHGHLGYLKRPGDVSLPYRPINHQLAGEISKRRQIPFCMLEDGQMPVDVRHLPLAALEANLGRDQSCACRKDRQLQLRHTLVLPSHTLWRNALEVNSISKIVRDHGTTSGVLILYFGQQLAVTWPIAEMGCAAADNRGRCGG